MRLLLLPLLLLAAIVPPILPAAAPGPASGPARAAPTPCAEPCPDVLPRAVMEAVSSVVRVRSREVLTTPVFHNSRFRQEPVEGQGAGSGVIVSEDGLVLTNAHVVDGSKEITVEFLGGQTSAARVVSIDPASDLALLRVAASDLHPIPFADGPLPEVGTAAYLIGNPGDVGLQVTWARIGPHRRVRVGTRPLEFWCEVEAAIGPGDSGGALLDASGRLLGIPGLQVNYSAERAPGPLRSAGLFIPAAHAARSMGKMLEGPSASWPWVGLLLEDPLLVASDGGAWNDADAPRVRHVFPGGPAATAGVRAGDRIVAIGGRTVRDNFEALDAALDLEAGKDIVLTLDRAGRRLSLGITAAVRPDDPRPGPFDDFALHTGLRLRVRSEARNGHSRLALAGLSAPAVAATSTIEAGLLAQDLVLGSLVPGQDLLAGQGRPVRVFSDDDLAALLPRCFVRDQFVALAHWSRPGSATVDRAHVHRKIYPVVL